MGLTLWVLIRASPWPFAVLRLWVPVGGTFHHRPERAGDDGCDVPRAVPTDWAAAL